MELLNIPEVKYVLAGLAGLALLIFIDVVLAVANAIKEGVFSWYELTAFLRTNVLPYLIAWTALALVPIAMRYAAFPQEVIVPLDGLVVLAYGTCVATLIKSIYDNLKAIGLPVDEV